MKIDRKSALIVVDLQNDFCPGGALPVPEGDKVVPILNDYIKEFSSARAKIVATRDWHPVGHISFKEKGGPWPPHCVQNSPGAAFHPGLRLLPGSEIVSKATDPESDAYSGFQGTDLAARLQKLGIEHLYIGGLATDYCVKSTVVDALAAGFCVTFLEDASRAVNVKPGDGEAAIAEMAAAGANRATLKEIL